MLQTRMKLSPHERHVRSVDIEMYDFELGCMRVYDNQSIANLALLAADATDSSQ